VAITNPTYACESIVIQYTSIITLTAIRPGRIYTRVITAAIYKQTFIYIYKVILHE